MPGIFGQATPLRDMIFGAPPEGPPAEYDAFRNEASYAEGDDRIMILKARPPSARPELPPDDDPIVVEETIGEAIARTRESGETPTFG